MSARRRQPITAAELKAGLEADPDWRGRRDERERRRAGRERELRAAEAPLVDELRATGHDVDSVWELVETATPYPAAIPVLLEHLDRPYPDRVREGIARALAAPEARGAWPELLALYDREPAGTDAKVGLAAALAAVADDAVLDDVLARAMVEGNGDSRVLLLGALERVRDPRAREALERLTADPLVGQEARHLLGRTG